MNIFKLYGYHIKGEYMKENTYLNKKELVTFLEYLLGHVEDCYYNECKNSIQRFLNRNNIKE